MMCLYEQNAYTLEPGKVQVRTFQVGKTIVLLPLTFSVSTIVFWIRTLSINSYVKIVFFCSHWKIT